MICLHCVVDSTIESFAYMLHTQHTHIWLGPLPPYLYVEIEVKSRLICFKRKRFAHDVLCFYSTLHSNFVRDCTMFHIASYRELYDCEITSSNSKQKKTQQIDIGIEQYKQRKFYSQNTIFFIQFSRRKNEKN